MTERPLKNFIFASTHKFHEPTTAEKFDFCLPWRDKHNIDFKYPQGVFLK